MATRVERSGIESCISRINGAIEQLEAAANVIDRTMGELPQYWEGAAYESAKATYEGEYKTLLTSTVPTAVGEFRGYIEWCKNKIVEIDNQLAGG